MRQVSPCALPRRVGHILDIERDELATSRHGVVGNCRVRLVMSLSQ
jgi:hypothetical protein